MKYFILLVLALGGSSSFAKDDDVGPKLTPCCGDKNGVKRGCCKEGTKAKAWEPPNGDVNLKNHTQPVGRVEAAKPLVLPAHKHDGKAINTEAEFKDSQSNTGARIHWCSHCHKFWNDNKVVHAHF